MYKVSLVDDEPENLALLEDYLKRYGLENNIEFVIKKFQNGLDFIATYRSDCDLVFMDIQMPDMDGMETARKLREIDNSVSIIFITNLIKYAVHGYEVRAFDFVVKPVNYYDFASRMKRFTKHIHPGENRELMLLSGDMVRKVRVSDIYYAEVAGHNVRYKFVDGEMYLRESLVKTERTLSEPYFVRCNNGILVNLNYVQALEKDMVQVAGDWLPISRAKKKDFVMAVTEHFANM